MFFIKHGRDVYHVVAEREEGLTVCGVRVSRVAQLMFERGLSTFGLTRTRPQHMPLCKNCEQSVRLDEVVCET